ncbi:pirin family protein [Niveibacterium sp. 24ML]|uniref:pirin family protein n=1 Tax=Niveibacterium sp. 24ML TaxID=2985512 RepID=UPI0022713AFC|nr:pirin family protein [Niveibacterium sp. 24ML]MCX9155854.1 pirin family protein [Niveibacterium sp. 24ML]
MNAPETVTLIRSRKVERLVAGVPTSDGAGVKLTRVLTQPLQRRLDPFLMLDAFGSESASDYIAGFPPHPHRGFETITYMLTGRMRHRDSAGHEGLIEDGGVQWMSAARGVIHSEMPEQTEGRMEGFQLWLNLPGATKMADPWYRDIPSAGVPSFVTDAGVTVRVIAGESHGHAGAMQRPDTEPLYLDVHLPAGSRFEQAIPPGHNAFIYVYRGEVAIGGDQEGVGERRMAILANDAAADGIAVQACKDARLIIVAGKPLGEPIVQYGPFVMNTREEIEATLQEFRDGRFEAMAGSLPG